jgi:acetolactate synthase I/III small subunit
MAIHTLSVLVENSPGVLARVAALFSRRGYNIDSLAVGPTEDPRISRMTIVLNLEGHALDQVSAQLFKLINVIGIQEMKPKESYERELLLVKVAKQDDALNTVLSKHGARIVDDGETPIIEAVAESDHLEALLKDLDPYEVIEIVQSGVIALERGKMTLIKRVREETGLSNPEDPSSNEVLTADYQN